MQNHNGSANGNGAHHNYLNQNEGFDFKYLVAKVVGNWKWFALSLVLCLSLGVVYILYAIPSFIITARVWSMVKTRIKFKAAQLKLICCISWVYFPRKRMLITNLQQASFTLFN
jgi:hypothetical protein